MVKAIFFDIDGTLLSFKTHKVSKKSLEALRVAQQKGIKLFIATGRHPSEVNHFDGFAFDGHITMNGQYCFTPERPIFKNYINKEDISVLVSLLKKDPLTCIFMEEERVYFNRESEDIQRIREIVEFHNYVVLDAEEALGKEIYQIIPIIPKEKELSIMKNLSNCETTRWHPLFLDIIPKGGSKKTGIQKMLDHYAISSDEIIAIGDGGNDIPMLELAGISVAMGNASEEVKSYADYVTLDVDNEGVHNALQHFGII